MRGCEVRWSDHRPLSVVLSGRDTSSTDCCLVEREFIVSGGLGRCSTMTKLTVESLSRTHPCPPLGLVCSKKKLTNQSIEVWILHRMTDQIGNLVCSPKQKSKNQSLFVYAKSYWRNSRVYSLCFFRPKHTSTRHRSTHHHARNITWPLKSS